MAADFTSVAFVAACAATAAGVDCVGGGGCGGGSPRVDDDHVVRVGEVRLQRRLRAVCDVTSEVTGKTSGSILYYTLVLAASFTAASFTVKACVFLP